MKSFGEGGTLNLGARKLVIFFFWMKNTTPNKTPLLQKFELDDQDALFQ